MCIRHGAYGDQTYSQPSFQKSLIFKWQIDKEVKKKCRIISLHNRSVQGARSGRNSRELMSCLWQRTAAPLPIPFFSILFIFLSKRIREDSDEQISIEQQEDEWMYMCTNLYH